MDDGWSKAMWGAMGGAAGVFITATYRWLIDKQRLQDDDKKEVDATALSTYQQMVINLGPRVSALETEIRQVSKERAECREENASMKVEITALRRQIRRLRAIIKRLHGPDTLDGDC